MGVAPARQSWYRANRSTTRGSPRHLPELLVTAWAELLVTAWAELLPPPLLPPPLLLLLLLKLPLPLLLPLLLMLLLLMLLLLLPSCVSSVSSISSTPIPSVSSSNFGPTQSTCRDPRMVASNQVKEVMRLEGGRDSGMHWKNKKKKEKRKKKKSRKVE